MWGLVVQKRSQEIEDNTWINLDMRIAFIVGPFPLPLSQTFILNQITGLIDRGHDVDIYSTAPNDFPKVHSDVETYNLRSRTYYQRIPGSLARRRLKAIFLLFRNFHKDPVTLLRSLNVSKYGKEATSLNLFYSTLLCLNIRKKYDIINCHFGWRGSLAILLRELGVLQGQVVTTFHGLDITSDIRKFGDQVYKQLFIQGDLFLPISERWQHRLVELDCNKDKIIVHHMGINCDRFHFTPRQLSATKTVRFVSISRLTEKKGIEYGVRAISKLAKRKYPIEYNVVGDGPLKQDLEQLIIELGLEDTVKLLGWKQQQEIVDILNQSHIFIAPSVTATNGDQEGIPVVLMEAMAMGLPIVSTQHSGIPELVEEGVSGFLVPERDVDALTEKLAHLIEHPEIWPAMGKAGRIQVEEHYNIDKLNDRLVKLYQKLANQVLIEPAKDHSKTSLLNL